MDFNKGSNVTLLKLHSENSSLSHPYEKSFHRTREKTQEIQVLVTKPEDLTKSHKAQMVERK